MLLDSYQNSPKKSLLKVYSIIRKPIFLCLHKLPKSLCLKEKYHQIVKNNIPKNIKMRSNIKEEKTFLFKVLLIWSKVNDFQSLFIKNSKFLYKCSSVSIVFSNNQKIPIKPMNLLKADQIGHLIVTKGIVTRVS